MGKAEFSRMISSDFCHVERREGEKSRYYVVHAGSPRFVAEIEPGGESPAGSSGVIRRVVVPNSWSGEYHHCGQLLGAAVSFFDATHEHPNL